MAKSRHQDYRQALDQMKHEFAAELGLYGSQAGLSDTEFADELGANSSGGYIDNNGYWGHVSSRQAGAVGGSMTRSLVQLAQQLKL